MIKNYIEIAVDMVRKNRMRSFLTCFGVAIGVASLVLILSLTGGVKNILSGKLNGQEKGGVMVLTGKNEQGLTEFWQKNEKMDEIEMKVPVKVGYEQIVGGKEEVTTTIIGTIF